MSLPETCHVIVRCEGSVMEDEQWPVARLLDLVATFPRVVFAGREYRLGGYLLGSPNKRILRFEIDLAPVEG